MNNIAIFASGAGSNAQRIMEHFSTSEKSKVALLLTNNKLAGVIEKAKVNNVPTVVFNREEFYKTDNVLDILKQHNINFIVLAGFLWLVPNNILQTFPNSIINIHPALLPAYGGKGMYGDNVHKAVIAAGEKKSGITIHYVNAEYDKGDIVFQATCSISKDDTPETLASKIHVLEHQHFPLIIEQVLSDKLP